LRVLIVEDERISGLVLQQLLSPFAECDLVVDGAQAIDAFTAGLTQNKPYDLICMDIMMPVLNGQEALIEIRKIEKKHNIFNNGVKVIMTTALDDQVNIMKAFCQGGAMSYIVKPITPKKLYTKISEIGFNIPENVK